MNNKKEEIDYTDNKKKYQTKAQKELNENQVTGYEDHLEGWNDIEEDETT